MQGTFSALGARVLRGPASASGLGPPPLAALRLRRPLHLLSPRAVARRLSAAPARSRALAAAAGGAANAPGPPAAPHRARREPGNSALPEEPDAPAARLQLDAAQLGRALAFEEGSGFANARGRHFESFHLFLVAQLRALLRECGATAGRQYEVAASVSLLHEAQAYADLDAAQRAGVVRGVRALLAREAAAPAPAGRVPAPGPRAPLEPPPQAPLEPRGRKARGVVFFDLETSGLSPNNHRIIEVAAQGAASGRTFATLVNPGAGVALSPKIVGLTGISDAAVHAPSVPDFSRAAAAFQEFVAAEAAAAGAGAGDAAEVCLVAHNGRKFDVPFLAAEFRRAGLELPPEWTFFDSYLFSRDALAQAGAAGAPSSAAPPLQFNLQALRAHFGLPEPAREHRALDDVRVLAGVYQSLKGLYPSEAAWEAALAARTFRARDLHQWSAAKRGAGPAADVADLVRDPRRVEELEAFAQEPDPVSTVEHWGATRTGMDLAVAARALRELKVADDVVAAHPLAAIPVAAVPGLRPKQRRQLAEAGLGTVQELLRHYPREHVAYKAGGPVADGDHVHLQGTLAEVGARVLKRGLGRIHLVVRTEDAANGPMRFHVSIFIRGAKAVYVAKIGRKYRAGERVAFRGEVASRGVGPGGEPEWEVKKASIAVDVVPWEEGAGEGGRVRSVYPAKAPLKPEQFGELTAAALEALRAKTTDAATGQEADPLPAEVRAQYGLVGRLDALRTYHAPERMEDLAAARKRLVFEELFMVQLALLLRRQRLLAARSEVDLQGTCIGGSPLLEAARRSLPFALTEAQERALGEVLSDMAGPVPMMRLLQGDVGCGKTIVAFLALAAACGAGWQGALMVPTEVLAEQHAAQLEAFLEGLGPHLPPGARRPAAALLTGSTKAARRREVLAGLEAGTIDLVVGTHALISEGVQFAKLGAAIIDEQHKFGVEQRARLQSKNRPPPHILSMSATPIPRTLSLTLHGDMALSFIDELPPGRAPVATRVLPASAEGRAEAYARVRAEVAAGHKAFVVCPAIDSEREGLAEASAEAQLASLRADLPGLRCGLLHGRLGAAEKARAQAAFRGDAAHAADAIDVLVATSVVEVGVDVPEATVILVEGAERFGLAQLHQLRGRVGRAAGKPSWCFLVTGAGAEAEAAERLRALERTNDGFAVAEVDLMLRGPGQLVGTRQAGQLPSFHLTDLNGVGDRALLMQAREAAAGLLVGGMGGAEGVGEVPEGLRVWLEQFPPLPELDLVELGGGGGGEAAA